MIQLPRRWMLSSQSYEGVMPSLMINKNTT